MQIVDFRLPISKNHLYKIPFKVVKKSEYDKEIPQTHTADQPTAP